MFFMVIIKLVSGINFFVGLITHDLKTCKWNRHATATPKMERALAKLKCGKLKTLTRNTYASP